MSIFPNFSFSFKASETKPMFPENWCPCGSFAYLNISLRYLQAKIFVLDVQNQKLIKSKFNQNWLQNLTFQFQFKNFSDQFLSSIKSLRNVSLCKICVWMSVFRRKRFRPLGVFGPEILTSNPVSFFLDTL